jgi:hypothetical protein
MCECDELPEVLLDASEVWVATKNEGNRVGNHEGKDFGFRHGSKALPAPQPLCRQRKDFESPTARHALPFHAANTHATKPTRSEPRCSKKH